MSESLSPEEVKDQYLFAMGEELGSLYHYLNNECTLLHLDWDEFKELFAKSQDRFELLNESAPGFFSNFQDILWETVLLRIARLMDPASSGGKGKDNASLAALESLVDQGIRDEFAELLAAAKSKCEFALDGRNRRIAHRDRNLALERAVPLIPATRLDVDHALVAIASTLNLLEFRYCGASVAYEYSIGDRFGAEALVYLIRDGLEARKEFQRRLEMREISQIEMVRKRRPI